MRWRPEVRPWRRLSRPDPRACWPSPWAPRPSRGPRMPGRRAARDVAGLGREQREPVRPRSEGAGGVRGLPAGGEPLPYGVTLPLLVKTGRHVHGVSRRQMLVTPGSGEDAPLRHARVHLAESKALVTASPTFETPANAARTRRRPGSRRPRRCLGLARSDGDGGKGRRRRALFFVCNPNNPTGRGSDGCRRGRVRRRRCAASTRTRSFSWTRRITSTSRIRATPRRSRSSRRIRG